MTGSLNRRERKKIHSKNAIVEAAVKMFGEKGYQETTVADIMHAADLGIGTFYNYFESKEDILKFQLSEIIMEINRSYQTLAGKERSAAENITEMFLLTARILDERRFVLPLFLSAANRGASPKEYAPDGQPAFRHMFEQMVAEGQANGEFRDDVPPQIVAEMFHSVFQAASFSRLSISFMDNIQFKLSLILDGIRATGKSASSS